MKDIIVSPAIESYIASLDARAEPVRGRMEELARRRDFPIIGPQVGRLLGIIARFAGARRILELGSGFGYSAFWFARAVPEDGRVICTDFSSSNRDLALGFFNDAGLAGRIEFIVGDALETARGLHGPFDIVFNDIDKESYPDSVDVALGLLRPGGLFVTDNVLWSGRVTESHPEDSTVEAIRKLNSVLSGRADLQTVIVPVRDGVAIAQKR